MRQVIGVLVMAYGGPDRIQDVEPYLLDVRGYRETPAEVIAEVTERYEAIGGRSPILERTRDQADALQDVLDRRGGDFRTFVGMRHWHPFLKESAAAIEREGIRRVIGLVMAPHYSRMSVEAYFASLQIAVNELRSPIEVARIESWKDDAGYLGGLERRIHDKLLSFPNGARDQVHLVFTAHSLPERILTWDDPYPEELEITFKALAARFPHHPSSFAYQSAAMTPDPWLGPDAGDLMVSLIQEGGTRDFLIVPIGFVSEHVEILYDIDIEFQQRVRAAGGRLERIDMLGADPQMITSLAGKVRRLAQQRGWI